MSTKSRRWFSASILAAAGALLLAPVSVSVAQRAGLRIGGGSANFGVFSLTGGFTPDPNLHAVTSGGGIDASTLSLAPGCRGYVTAQPDVIVRYQSPAQFLRFFNRASGDTTLVINAPDGRWYCDDDSGGSTNPQIDFNHPQAGQYDIWVGSYRAGENVSGQLGVTELSSQHP